LAIRVELAGCMVTKGTIMGLELGSVEEESVEEESVEEESVEEESVEEESVGIFMNIDIFVHMVE
jgi:hypothetical protein